jgi:hypothetical protein
LGITKENSEKIWKLQKKVVKRICKIWKKTKLNSEKIWIIEKKIVKRYGKYRRKL